MTIPAERLLFLNLPVQDLEATKTFFEGLGFAFDPKFTDQSAACMRISDKAFAMFLQTDRFAEFASKPVGDPQTTTPGLYALSADDRASVDRFADAALAAGGTPAKEPIDMGFMYGRSFLDLDGHHWEVMWMDQAAIDQGPHDAVEVA